MILLKDLTLYKDILGKIYSGETSFNPNGWTKENPTYGHCAVVSLLLNDYCGGDIVKIKVNGESHYFNIIDGEIIDFTLEQFGAIAENIEHSIYERSSREYLLSNENTANRYKMLKKKFENEYYDNTYGCDKCAKRKFWDNINWITSSYGLCPECYDKLTPEEIEELRKKYE